ncbi:hypothetical protein [Fontivita pretiosa]|uniref:hypothetical protein n=1 Tax=Fontivita pretiosa TaxID=2989684 RepID=UPI003D186213
MPRLPFHTVSADPDPPVKCACPTCHCLVNSANAVRRDARLFCSQACAYDCTETMCVCVHEHCGPTPPPAASHKRAADRP